MLNKIFVALLTIATPVALADTPTGPQPPSPTTSTPLNPGQCTVACWTSGGGGSVSGTGLGGVGGGGGGGGFSQTCKLFCAPMVEKGGTASTK